MSSTSSETRGTLTGSLVPIDSHLHVWSDGKSPFPYKDNSIPPSDLQHCQAEDLLVQQMNARVGGALIVQPINHGYDHSYILSVMRSMQRMKGMCLMNPTLSIPDGLDYLKERYEEGFVGVRFNPYLWPADEPMSAERGAAFFAKAGELSMPVGFMCFKGLSLHYQDILSLLQQHPQTKVVLDHWGFFLQDGEVQEKVWQQLLSLTAFPQVHVKISALFRVSKQSWPYADLNQRLLQLVRTYGAHRLLWGSDYPFVQQQCGYSKAVTALREWSQSRSIISEEEWDFIYRRTAESLFGAWPPEAAVEIERPVVP